MKIHAAVFFLLFFPVVGFASGDELAGNFETPPASAEPQTWWHWMSGNVTREGITADLESMAKVGIGGAQIFNIAVGTPDGPVQFNSPEWREMVKHAATEADRLGLDLGLHNCAGWANSGGPWVTPEHGMQVVTTSELQVKGPCRFNAVLPQPPTQLNGYREIGVLAFRTPAGEPVRLEELPARIFMERGRGEFSPVTAVPMLPEECIPTIGIVNLTDYMQGGRLVWDVPEGDWTLLRLGYTPNGQFNRPAPKEGKGLECDKLSKEAVEAYWAGGMDPLIEVLGPLAGKSFNNVLVDSYEVGAQNWTPKFREEFQQRRGYDLLPYLPTLTGRIVESPEVTERFLWDFRRTIADLFAENYAGTFAEQAHKNGLLYAVEPYGSTPHGGPPCDNLQYGSYADMPMGEFWATGSAVFTVKLAASAAHVNGRRIVGAESFTAGPQDSKWKLEPFALKVLGDRVFCAGANRLIFHSTAHDPWTTRSPGMTMGLYGTHFGRTATWWNQGSAWLSYLARCQYLLQQGRFVADACFYVGESVPSALPPHALPPGYDYDACDTGAINRMTVKNGRLTLPDGMNYRMLVLPSDNRMTPATLRKIKELADDGATIIGPKPTRSLGLTGYPQCDEEVRKLAAETRIITDETPEQRLAALDIPPDFEAAGPVGGQMAYIHRETDDADIYFVSNQQTRNVETECIFRVRGKIPELWHPDSGRIEPAPVWREDNGRTVVPLRLDPAGSVFVVFRKPAVADHIVSVQYSAVGPAGQPAESLTILKAVYGVLDAGHPVPGKTIDITENVAALVWDGCLALTADNQLAGLDPAPRIEKKLLLSYRYGGGEKTITLKENEKFEVPEGRVQTARPSYALAADTEGQVTFHAARPGRVEARTAGGKVLVADVATVPESIEIIGPWGLNFPPNWGAPARVVLPELISWTQHPDPGVKYFSGTATYRTEFEWKLENGNFELETHLDLGEVKNIAEVTLNGVDLGILWKPPFAVDITAAVRPGRNRIEIKVTNLWPNRLIGDEHLPPDCEWNQNGGFKVWPQWLLDGEPSPTGRLTFTAWRHWKKNDAPLESGLLGPVTIAFEVKTPLNEDRK